MCSTSERHVHANTLLSAELCSSMPTSGGLYYAAAVLAPPGWGPFAAWVTGWSNWLAQVTGAPSVNYALSAMILAAASIVNPDYVPQNYQVFLLTMLIMIIHGVISSMPTKWIAQFNSAGSTFNIVALFVVIILIPAGNDRESRGLTKWNSNSDVWGNFYTGTEFPNGVAVLMSFISVIWTMSGYDAPFHLAEEASAMHRMSVLWIADERLVLKRQHRVPTRHCLDVRGRRRLRLVPATRHCLRCSRHRRSPR